VQELAGRELAGEREYVQWLERKHGKLVCGHEMTNAMAVFDLTVFSCIYLVIVRRQRYAKISDTPKSPPKSCLLPLLN